MTACVGTSNPSDPVPIAFSIDLLSLNPQEHPELHQIAGILLENLPQIGIGINIVELTTNDKLAERTWNYPIGFEHGYTPTYAEGGFDIVLREVRWDLDYYDYEGYFDCESIPPYGLNYYQYIKDEFDNFLCFSLNESDDATRYEYQHKCNLLLYDELPAIPICYPRTIFSLKNTVSGIDWSLLPTDQHRLENWENTYVPTLNYGFQEELSGTNIFKKNSKSDSFWTQAVYGSLYTRNQDEVWVPMIANSTFIKSTHNGKMNVTVGIDQLSKFSDGSQILSEDVKYSYELHLNSSLVSNQQINYAKCFQSIESISIIDNYTIQFNLDKIYYSPHKILSLGLVDKSKIEPLINAFGYAIFDELPGTYDVQYNLVTSCDPYMLDSLDLDLNLFNLSPNPYWNNLTFSNGIQPHLLSINGTYVSNDQEGIEKLELGIIDIIELKTSNIPSLNSGYSNAISKSPITIELGVNMKHPVIGTGELTPLGTSDAAIIIRKGISHAIPRDNIVVEILMDLGAPASIQYPDQQPEYGDYVPYVYDLDLARSYVESVGRKPNPPTPSSSGSDMVILSMSFAVVITTIIMKKKRKKA
jgi:ABC-type transport system substrate-binding protein